MRSLLALVAVIALLIAVGSARPVYATTAYVYDNEDFHCNVAQANDLHITYYSDTKMRLVTHYDDGFPSFTATPTGPDSMTWSCLWSGQEIVYCQWVHVGVVFEQEARNELLKRDIYWTYNGVPVGDLYGPGFSVEPPELAVTQVEYTIVNNTLGTIVIEDLQTAISYTEISLPDMMYPIGEISWDSPRNDITLGPGDSYSEYIQVKESRGWLDSYYLLAQGAVKVDGSVEGHFVHQHEHPLEPIQQRQGPSLTEWGIILLVLLMLGTSVYVLRQRRRPEAR